MLGLFLTFLFAIGAAGVGRFGLRRLLEDSDPALAFGLSGLCGLGILGTLTLPIALLPGGARWGLYPICLLSLAGYPLLWKYRFPVSVPKRYAPFFLLAALLVAAMALVGVLAPSDSLDWDTLAYHLAVPKIWLAAGQMHYISFIHHSNFPGVIDDLYLWGLTWGGESGAKAFSLMFGFFGAFALFGFARKLYSESAGWWAVLAYVGIPLVGWECGTGYIDIGNGLFAGLGILFAALYLKDPLDKRTLWLSGICLGFATASKYTGFETILAVWLVVLSASRFKLDAFKLATAAALISVAIASPWYVKNIVNTGNPIYPFFYSVFKGKNWDAFSDQIYKHQQQTFGAGREFAAPGQDYPANPLEPLRLGGAILGLAYQPGRYADPAPTLGGGFPFVSLGAIPLSALLAWLFSGKTKIVERACSATILISLCMWFVLSEQSRYIVGLFFPACVMAGGAIALLRSGPLLAAAGVIQVLASFYVQTRFSASGDGSSQFGEKMKVVLGTLPPEDYQKRYVSFYEPAQSLNALAKDGRVALYDEVFGYFLDVPYFWANPGHSTQIGYEGLTDADGFVAALKRLGITHVYINLGLTFGGDRKAFDDWIAASGMESAPVPYPSRDQMMKNPQDAYKVLLAEAIAKGKLVRYQSFGVKRFIFVVGS